jgi:hypothetical protein
MFETNEKQGGLSGRIPGQRKIKKERADSMPALSFLASFLGYLIKTSFFVATKLPASIRYRYTPEGKPSAWNVT